MVNTRGIHSMFFVMTCSGNLNDVDTIQIKGNDQIIAMNIPNSHIGTSINVIFFDSRTSTIRSFNDVRLLMRISPVQQNA